MVIETEYTCKTDLSSTVKTSYLNTSPLREELTNEKESKANERSK